MLALLKSLIEVVPGFALFITQLIEGDTAAIQRVREILPERLPTDDALAQ